jgi:DNA-binding response OmpR family regulator
MTDMNPRLAPVRLLLVDDDPSSSEDVRAWLRSRGFDAYVEPEPARAVAHAHEGRSQVVLWNLSTPDALDQVRQVQKRTGLPVVLLADDEQSMVAALDAGVDDCLNKSGSREELLARLRASLRRRSAAARLGPAVPVTRTLVLDTERREALRDSRVVPLTPIEYGLLEYLVAANGAVVPREELMRAVCGHAEPAGRALDVHVSRLRRKLSCRRTLIRTVRGAGYVFCAEAETRTSTAPAVLEAAAPPPC